MNKTYQVFVSSTYADLSDERRKVSETLAKAGFIPSGMELFPAADQQQFDFIKRVIDKSDYYVVIVGGRYGSLADDAISFTQMEFEYARSKGIPVLAFLHARPDEIPANKTDQNSRKSKKLRAFRDTLAEGRLVDFWLEPNELCTKVVIAVINATNLTPGVGWIRGDEAIDPKVLQETERLRIENTELRRKLSAYESTPVSFPPDLAGPEAEAKFTIQRSNFADGSKTEIEARASWRNIFYNGLEEILLEDSEAKVGMGIAKRYAKAHHPQLLDNEFTFKIAAKDLRTMRFHFEALGLIKAEARDSNHGSRQIYWKISDKGRQYIAQYTAILSGSEQEEEQ